MRRFGRTVSVITAVLLAGTLLSSCGGTTSADGKVHIEFFQNKPEAKDSFDKLVAKFNAENPNIEVTQVNPPDAETVLLTRVVKNDEPDIVGMGATDTFSILSQSGIFEDLTGQPLLDRVNPAYVKQITDVTGMADITGVPYATNANGIMYNKEIFRKLNLQVPKTWDELIQTAQAVKAAGIIPFYFTYKDDWQTNLSFNALGPNIVGNDFFKARRAGETTFKEHFREVAEKMLALLDYGHSDNFGKTYADGNRSFARGEAAMYIQGTWAIPELRKTNPDLELGFFPFPTGNDPNKVNLISGVDTLLAITQSSKHKEEAAKFVEFLLQPENIGQYIDEQTAFAAVEGVNQDDPAVAELKPYFEQSRFVDFADHFIPAAVQLNSITQSFLQNHNIDWFLNTLDTEWDKVANRRQTQ
ncbi:ABC transporter substrate-binding protein [Paenibacillus yonginensis]|uniref:ABC transporter substrate-binding protein n=1 Tax=Paenibacillus yonginensis TaxID=1462996 RepID=A0A1B1MWF7_9BACL|nr:ABC transporter substrate-binding protein [Paenibacillus yonginensis]ANS73477.1 ABC transporter substrate-binding protein [Paenibacillus yonginensis]